MNAPVFVAGHRGLVGSAIVRGLQARGASKILTRTRAELNLLDQRDVLDFFKRERPAQVYLAAAKVGGIEANRRYQADFLYENLTIAANVIHAAHETGGAKLLFLGSSCIYPREAEQPMRETSLLSGPLEPTNEGYAIAKIAGLKLCEHYARQYGDRFISAMPTNLYGPGDNFHPEHSHVIPGLLRRFHEAKVSNAAAVTVWGSGRPRREFLHVDDLAAALITLMDRYDQHETVNVGCGEDVSLKELAGLLADVVGFRGELRFDTLRPDGTPRKLLDVSKIKALGWQPRISLAQGLRDTYHWAVQNSAFQ